jgi:hypothetical protein
MVVNAFYEHVSRHAMEHRELAPGEVEEDVVLDGAPTGHVCRVLVVFPERR